MALLYYNKATYGQFTLVERNCCRTVLDWTRTPVTLKVAVWLSDHFVGRVNEVTLRPGGLAGANPTYRHGRAWRSEIGA